MSGTAAQPGERTTGPSAGLSVAGVSKSFGAAAEPVLDDVSLTVEPGTVAVLLGRSGSGKSTLLSIVAGVVDADRGSVSLDGRTLDGVAPHRRGVTLLTQQPHLLPFTSVAGNVAFSPVMKRLGRRERTERVAAMLDQVGLAGFERRRPSSLSGGEQHRVALARALCTEPRVLLLDEPFSGLDQPIRLELQATVRRLVTERSLICVFVTHQLDEAMAMGNRVLTLDRARIQAAMGPRQLYERPPNPASASLVGNPNRLTGRVSGGRLRGDGWSLPIDAVHWPDGQPLEGSDRTVSVRPERLRLRFCGSGGGGEARLEPQRTVAATVAAADYRGGRMRVCLDVCGTELVAELIDGGSPLYAGGTQDLAGRRVEAWADTGGWFAFADD